MIVNEAISFFSMDCFNLPKQPQFCFYFRACRVNAVSSKGSLSLLSMGYLCSLIYVVADLPSFSI